VEAAADARGGEVGPQPPLRQDEQVHGVGQQPVLDPLQAGRRLGAAEGQHHRVVALADEDLRVARRDQPRVEVELGAELRRALVAGEVGQVGRQRQQARVARVAGGVGVERGRHGGDSLTGRHAFAAPLGLTTAGKV
jgi:hypothetical protein